MNPAKLAKKTVKRYLENKEKISTSDSGLEKLLSQKGGVFVTINKNKKLRGCIGTLEATKENLANEIISSAISACKDPRFSPIKREEFPNLTFEVNILSKKEPVPKEKINEINPQKEGVIVKSGLRRGLLLPNIEGIDSPQKQISVALKKAKIKKNEDYQIFKFKTESYEEI